MKLDILESKNGTRVVIATDLYSARELPAQNYARESRKWIKDVYEFSDDIRRPECFRDFAKRPRPGQPIVDYYLSLELARKIALHSQSKVKARVARYLQRVEVEVQTSLFAAA